MKTEHRPTCRSCGRVRSPSGPPALVALNLRLHRKAGRFGDATLPTPLILSAFTSSSWKDTVNPAAAEQAVERFEHDELVTGEDGKPVELGRGAMLPLNTLNSGMLTTVDKALHADPMDLSAQRFRLKVPDAMPR